MLSCGRLIIAFVQWFQVVIEKEYLQLEPIGLIFVIFFAVIMIIQFTGMLFHRFETLSHILASIELSCCNQKVEDVSDDAFIDRNAIQIARQLQRLKGIDEDDDNSDEYLGPERLERRKTIQNLEKRRHQRARTGTLDVAFRKRFMNINAQENNEGASINRTFSFSYFPREACRLLVLLASVYICVLALPVRLKF